MTSYLLMRSREVSLVTEVRAMPVMAMDAPMSEVMEVDSLLVEVFLQELH